MEGNESPIESPSFEEQLIVVASASAGRQSELKRIIRNQGIVIMVLIVLLGASNVVQGCQAARDRDRYIRRIDELQAQNDTLARSVDGLTESVSRRPVVFDYVQCAMGYVVTVIDTAAAGGDVATAQAVLDARAALDRAGRADVSSGEPVSCVP